MRHRAAAKQQIEGITTKWTALGKREVRTDSILLTIALGVIALDDTFRELLNVHRGILRELHPVKSLGIKLDSTPRKEGDDMPLPVTSLDLQHDAVFTAAPTDADGNLVADPSLAWHSGNEAIASVEVSADGLTCKAVTKTAGSVTIFASDGVLSDGFDLSIGSGPSVAALNVTVQVVPKVTP